VEENKLDICNYCKKPGTDDCYDCVDRDKDLDLEEWYEKQENFELSIDNLSVFVYDIVKVINGEKLSYRCVNDCGYMVKKEYAKCPHCIEEEGKIICETSGCEREAKEGYYCEICSEALEEKDEV
jgi:hypothetical protein